MQRPAEVGQEEIRSEKVAVAGDEEIENAELVLFHVKECYVYMIPPRKSAASYRADEWNINKWAWEGAIRIVSKGEECTIRLEDKTTGELYAQSPVRRDQPLPVEAVIDSSRFFVLRIEDNSSGQARHAFIGVGFRERPPAYDFQAALYDHMKYLNKKKHAEEMEQEYQSKPSTDYSLKEGETFRLQIKAANKMSIRSPRSKFFDENMDTLTLDKDLSIPATSTGTTAGHGAIPCLAPPPPPPASPVNLLRVPSVKTSDSETDSGAMPDPLKLDDEDDFGDFQTAG